MKAIVPVVITAMAVSAQPNNVDALYHNASRLQSSFSALQNIRKWSNALGPDDYVTIHEYYENRKSDDYSQRVFEKYFRGNKKKNKKAFDRVWKFADKFDNLPSSLRDLDFRTAEGDVKIAVGLTGTKERSHETICIYKGSLTITEDKKPFGKLSQGDVAYGKPVGYDVSELEKAHEKSCRNINQQLVSSDVYRYFRKWFDNSIILSFGGNRSHFDILVDNHGKDYEKRSEDDVPRYEIQTDSEGWSY